MDSYHGSILSGLADVERMITQHYGQVCKPVAAVLVSEGNLSVCKLGAVSQSNTGKTEYLDYIDLSSVLSDLLHAVICSNGKRLLWSAVISSMQ